MRKTYPMGPLKFMAYNFHPCYVNKHLNMNFGRFFLRVYEIWQFIRRFFREVFLPPYEYKEIINQFFQVERVALGSFM